MVPAIDRAVCDETHIPADSHDDHTRSQRFQMLLCRAAGKAV